MLIHSGSIGYSVLNCDGGDAGTALQVTGKGHIIQNLWCEPLCDVPIAFVGANYCKVYGIYADTSTHAKTITVDGTSYYNEIEVTGGAAGSPAITFAASSEENIIKRHRTYAGVITDGGTRNVVNIQTSQIVVPATGNFLVGDVCWNAAAASGQPKGWICTVAGSPGTWVSIGNL
jgi:hypothetical protein